MYGTLTDAEFFCCAAHGRFVLDYVLAEFHGALLNNAFHFSASPTCSVVYVYARENRKYEKIAQEGTEIRNFFIQAGIVLTAGTNKFSKYHVKRRRKKLRRRLLLFNSFKILVARN